MVTLCEDIVIQVQRFAHGDKIQLKGVSSSKTTRWHILNFNKTCYMKEDASVAEDSSGTEKTITN